MGKSGGTIKATTLPVKACGKRGRNHSSAKKKKKKKAKLATVFVPRRKRRGLRAISVNQGGVGRQQQSAYRWGRSEGEKESQKEGEQGDALKRDKKRMSGIRAVYEEKVTSTESIEAHGKKKYPKGK